VIKLINRGRYETPVLEEFEHLAQNISTFLSQIFDEEGKPLPPAEGGTLDGSSLPAHAASHVVGGTDPVPVTGLAGYPGTTTAFLRDDAAFTAPVVTALAGFPGGTTTFLRADGTFAVPAGGGGGLTLPLAQDLTFSIAAPLVRPTTTDGADNAILILCGGGTNGPARGGSVYIAGNEYGGAPGTGGAIYIDPGNGASLIVRDNSFATIFQIGVAGRGDLKGPLYVGGAGPNGNIALQRSGSNIALLGNALDLGTGQAQEFGIHSYDSMIITVANNSFRVPPVQNSTVTGFPVYVSSDGRLARQGSSRRYKANIAALDSWQAALALRPVSFAFLTDPERECLGFIAEDVADVDPRLALWKDEQPEALDLAALLAATVATLQALDARVRALEAT